jgi:hypothetical protein
MKLIALAAALLASLTAAGVTVSLPFPGSRQVAFALLHLTDVQSQSDAEQIYHTFSKVLCGRGGRIGVNAANGDLSRALPKLLNEVIASDDHGGLFLYARCLARSAANNDLLLASATNAPEAQSFRFGQIMTELSKARDQRAIWVFLDLETELTEEQVRTCIGQYTANADPLARPVLVVAGIRTPEAEKDLEFSHERLAHWIAKGLEGAAGPPRGPGIDDPAAITHEELVSYLRSNLTAPSAPQNALRLVTSRDRSASLPETTPPQNTEPDGAVEQRPRFADEMIREQAREWADQFAKQKIRKIIIPKLLEDPTASVKSGFANHVHQLLVERMKRIAQDRYDVNEGGNVNAALQRWWQTQQNATQEASLASQSARDAIAADLSITPSELGILVGRLKAPGSFSHPAEFSLQLEAFPTPNKQPEAPPESARAVATPSLQLQAGMQSFVPEAPAAALQQLNLQPPPAIPIAPPPVNPIRLSDPGYVDSLKQQIEDHQRWADAQIHPLKSATLGVQLGISRLRNTIREKLPLSFSADQKTAWVTVRPGDQYGIDIVTKLPRGLFMRLFVDGLNTLPESEKKDDGSDDVVWKTASPANPDNAAYWYLPPNSIAAVNGFYSDVRQNTDSEFRTFQVVKAEEAEATSYGLQQETGLITAMFYEMQTVKPGVKQSVGGHGLGTKLGPKIKHEVSFYKGTDIPGKLVAVIQLQYRAPGD